MKQKEGEIVIRTRMLRARKFWGTDRVAPAIRISDQTRLGMNKIQMQGTRREEELLVVPVRTVDCHWVTSLRQMEVETTLTRISMGPGGATFTSSITSACPGPHATAAARHQTPMSQENTHTHARTHSRDETRRADWSPRQVMAAGGEEDDAAAAIAGDLPARLLSVRILVDRSQTIIAPSFRFSRGGLGRYD